MPSATSDAWISSSHHELLSGIGPNQYKMAYVIGSNGRAYNTSSSSILVHR